MSVLACLVARVNRRMYVRMIYIVVSMHHMIYVSPGLGPGDCTRHIGSCRVCCSEHCLQPRLHASLEPSSVSCQL